MIILLGLDLRLSCIRYTEVDTPIRADAKDYLFYAINLKAFNVYSRSTDAVEGKAKSPTPDAVRTPGYPLFISLFIGDNISDMTLFRITLAQALISTITIWLTYAAFASLLSRPLALLAALFTAISPHLINTNVYLLSESLFCFLLMLFLWLLSRWRPHTMPYLLLLFSGVIFALVTLTRPWTEYFILLLVPLIAFASPLQRPNRSALLLAVGFILPMAVWIGRNLTSLGMAGDDTLMINALHHGLYPGMMYDNKPETLGFPYRFDPRAAEISVSISSVLHEIINRFQASFPEYLQWYLFGKPMMMFSWNIFEGPGDVLIYPVLQTPYGNLKLFKATHWIMQTLHYWLVGLAALGCIAAWLPDARKRLENINIFFVKCVSALFAYFVVINCIGAPFARYSIPMQPIIYGMAMDAFWYIYTAFLSVKKNKNEYSKNL